MAKRKSDLSKIIGFFMGATEAEARAALDAAKTIVDDRFPTGARVKKAGGGGSRKRAGNGAAAGDAAGSSQS